jgi:hypothetical protein
VHAIPHDVEVQMVDLRLRMFETIRRHPLLLLNQAACDPLDMLAAPRDKLYSRIEPANTIGYVADSDRQDAQHRRLARSSEWVVEGFRPLWSTVVDNLRAQGIVGRTFQLPRLERRGCGLPPSHLVSDPPNHWVRTCGVSIRKAISYHLQAISVEGCDNDKVVTGAVVMRGGDCAYASESGAP